MLACLYTNNFKLLHIHKIVFSYKTTTNLQRWETDANDEIRYPIDEYRDRHGGWAGTLREQLGSDHPRDGAGPEGEEHDEAERGDDGQVRHPVNHLLHKAEELLLGRRVVFPPAGCRREQGQCVTTIAKHI